jgi:hypothetical protein
MQFNLTLKPIARSRAGVECGTGPIMLYEVEGLPGGQKISIRNIRLAGQQPIWQIGPHFRERETRWTGTFESADVKPSRNYKSNSTLRMKRLPEGLNDHRGIHEN